MRDGFKASFSTPVPSMNGTVHAKPNVGIPGKDGGYYIPSITQTDENDLQFEFLPSQKDMPPVDPVQVELPNSGGSGGLHITDDGEGNVTMTASGSVTITDDGNGNVVIA